METIARNTPQLTQAALASPASTVPSSLASSCATFMLKALRAAGNAYLEGARYNPFWIGAYWVPSARPESRRDER